MADQKFKSKVQLQGGASLPQQTQNTVPVLDANKDIVSSAVTSAELAHLSGVTSPIQTQLDAKADQTDLDSAQAEIDALVALSGVPALAEDLGSFTGAIITDNSTIKTALQELETFIEALPEPIVYKGTYDASTNTPTLSNSDTGVNGNLYRVVVAGTQDFGAGPISFDVGDSVVNNGTIWEKWDHSDQVQSVNGLTGNVQLDAENIPYDNASSGLVATDVQAAIDEIKDEIDNLPADFITSVSDSASVDLTVSAGALSATVLPAGVDHNALQNYEATEHVDHSAVEIIAGAGLSGGGDITTSRTLAVDITGQTPESSIALNDEFLVYDVSASALRKTTKADILSGIALKSPGDISETSFAITNDQSVAANVTGLVFSAAVVRGFKALVTVEVDATADLFETFELTGINKGGVFEMAIAAVGDESGIVFSITSAGQVQYTSADYAGFVSGSIKFRAETTTV